MLGNCFFLFGEMCCLLTFVFLFKIFDLSRNNDRVRMTFNGVSQTILLGKDESVRLSSSDQLLVRPLKSKR